MAVTVDSIGKCSQLGSEGSPEDNGDTGGKGLEVDRRTEVCTELAGTWTQQQPRRGVTSRFGFSRRTEERVTL